MTAHGDGTAVKFGSDRLAHVVEAMPFAVFILDHVGKAFYANHRARELLGRDLDSEDRAENLAERFLAFRAGTDERYPTESLPIVRALKGERASVDDLEIARGSGRIALEITATPILDANATVVFAVAVFQDITARRQAQRELAELNAHLEDEIHRRTEALELTVRRLQREMTTRRHYESQLLDAKAAADRANRSKTMFLMNVSHELRTPLNHLIGFSDLLTERVADPDARRLAQTAAASGRELEEKVDDLLALARAEAEHPGADPVAFDADAMMLHLARQSGIVYTDSQSVGRFIGDEQAVRDILTTVFQRAVNEDEKVGAATSTVDSAGTAVLVVRIDSDRLSRRVRALAYLFGEDGAEQDRRFHQQEIDFKLAIARARARVLGGDITCPGDAASQTIVEVTLPFLARP